jgi:hypothetical protein
MRIVLTDAFDESHPQVMGISGGGACRRSCRTTVMSGAVWIDVRLGSAAGLDAFDSQAGDAGVDVSIVAQ